MGRDWYHTLVTAPHRAKTIEELTAGENVVGDTWVSLTLRGVHDLDATIERLPDRTAIRWIGPHALRQRGTRASIVRLPPQQHLEEVQATCSEIGIDLRVQA